ncbi:MOSC domain-containing protein [bacterium]|nr:MOSC domain-containing protein [bacterium]MBU1599203.1 MOSC domain-containing protein [bacterium]MBU2462130.1 MOSC domain-containing protein [bacterium]
MQIAKSGQVVSVNISKNKGERKKPVSENWEVIKGCGLKDDGHANNSSDVQNETSHRQVSLLAIESIEKMQKMGLEVEPGDFAENITTAEIDLLSLDVGKQIRIGQEVILQISQIGKICHDRCAIYYQAGDCVMPREGIFAQVIKGGMIKAGDKIITE